MTPSSASSPVATRYLKEPNPPTVEATDELRARVAEILRDIERGGIDAVRRYSQELDGWAPDDFVVSEAEFRRAEAELDDELLGHIAFAQDQVRGFAQAQLATMSRARGGDGARESCSAIATSR